MTTPSTQINLVAFLIQHAITAKYIHEHSNILQCRAKKTHALTVLIVCSTCPKKYENCLTRTNVGQQRLLIYWKWSETKSNDWRLRNDSRQKRNRFSLHISDDRLD